MTDIWVKMTIAEVGSTAQFSSHWVSHAVRLRLNPCSAPSLPYPASLIPLLRASSPPPQQTMGTGIPLSGSASRKPRLRQRGTLLSKVERLHNLHTFPSTSFYFLWGWDETLETRTITAVGSNNQIPVFSTAVSGLFNFPNPSHFRTSHCEGPMGPFVVLHVRGSFIYLFSIQVYFIYYSVLVSSVQNHILYSVYPLTFVVPIWHHT